MNSRKQTRNNIALDINRKIIETVTTCEYQGSTMTQNGKTDLEINYKIKITNNVYYAHNTIFEKKEINTEVN